MKFSIFLALFVSATLLAACGSSTVFPATNAEKAQYLKNDQQKTSHPTDSYVPETNR